MTEGARSVPVRPPAGPVDGGFEGALFRTLQDAVLYARFPDRRVLDVNDAFCRLFGVPRERALAGTTEFMYPDRASFEAIGRRIGEAMRGGRPLVQEWTFRRGDGTDFPGELSLHPVGPYADRPVGAVSIVRDLTERKAAEARDRAQRAALEALLATQEALARDLDLDAVVQAATDGARVLAEAAFAAFFYNVPDDRGGSYMLYALSGVPREAFARYPMPRNTSLFGPTFAGEAVVRSDDVTKDPRYGKNAPNDGMPPGHLPVRSYLAVPVVSAEGVVHGGLFLGHPEPGRFTAEHEARVVAVAAQTAAAMGKVHLFRRARATEERLKRVLDNAPVQIATLDPDGRFVTLNRTASGVPVERVLGRYAWEGAVPEDAERVRAAIEGVLRTGTPAHYEASARVGDDTVRRFEVRAAPIELEGGRGAVLMCSDVTKRREDERELARARAALIEGEKLAALGSLVSGVAHEIRTPLTFLSTNAFLARLRLEKAAERGAGAAEALAECDRFLGEVMAGADRINQLVEDLRRYVRARKDVHVRPEQIHQVVADAVELFRATNRASVVVETSLSPAPSVRVNAGAVQQLVLNLLQNATDASPPGGVVRVASRPAADEVVVEVVDQGEGIPPHVRPRIFDPLFTTKPEGMGLGLCIVKRIADEHGASIEVETGTGRGTTFRVRFPLEAA